MTDIPTSMSADAPPSTPAGFPKNAHEFMRAVQDLFRHQYPVFVLDYDICDETYLVAWSDFSGTQRKSWLTQFAMNELTKHWVMN